MEVSVPSSWSEEFGRGWGSEGGMMKRLVKLIVFSGIASAGRKEEQMRVSSSKSGSHRTFHNGKALTRLQPGRHLPCVYICVCV